MLFIRIRSWQQTVNQSHVDCHNKPFAQSFGWIRAGDETHIASHWIYFRHFHCGVCSMFMSCEIALKPSFLLRQSLSMNSSTKWLNRIEREKKIIKGNKWIIKSPGFKLSLKEMKKNNRCKFKLDEESKRNKKKRCLSAHEFLRRKNKDARIRNQKPNLGTKTKNSKRERNKWIYATNHAPWIWNFELCVNRRIKELTTKSAHYHSTWCCCCSLSLLELILWCDSMEKEVRSCFCHFVHFLLFSLIAVRLSWLIVCAFIFGPDLILMGIVLE